MLGKLILVYTINHMIFLSTYGVLVFLPATLLVHSKATNGLYFRASGMI